ncbi:MAG: hypothetical protein P1U87_00915 [Verrucomicrobiales bacterium]|nr:hypothetical protein [Verrucomicrobiales bacterium]
MKSFLFKGTRFAAFSVLSLLFLTCHLFGGETITVDGTTYTNAEMVEISPDGPAYKTEAGDMVILPWTELSEAQLSTIKVKYPDAISNAMYDAYYIKGFVFHVSDDGHIIRISVEDGEERMEYKNGAIAPSSGLVLIKDIPTSVPQGEGAEIEIFAHKRKTYTFNIGIAVQEIPYLTVARPMWGMEQEWINTDGKKMYARLVAVKDGKGLFEKAGNRFVYELDKLDADAQTRAKEIAEKLKGFPMQ